MRKLPISMRVALTAAAMLLPAAAFAYTFGANLRLGDSGFDVVTLQQVLNASQDTRVADTGPGSPGQETAYFGQKTFDAVERFQSKYFAQVLAPGGLTVPTGFVGPATRAQLARVSTATTTASVSTVPSYTAPTSSSAQALPPVSTTDLSKLGPITLPSMSDRIELYIADVKKGLKDRGESSSTIAAVEEEIRKIAPQAQKTTDDFYKQEQDFYGKQARIDSPVMAFVESAFSTVSSFFVPATAHAALGLPFGGYVATVIPVCTCTPAISQIFVFLANPAAVATSNMTLDYAFGTEAFNWHNLPLPGIATLGLYEPVTPTCFMFAGSACIPIPSRGLITPVTGSSLSPVPSV